MPQEIFKYLLTNQSIASHSLCVYLIVRKIINYLPKNYITLGQERDLLAAAPVHDVGKSFWKPSWFTSPRIMISEPDWAIMTDHPIIGASILRETGKFSDSVIRIVEQHHERPGKKGYPQGIEPNLPVLILAACDTYVACTEAREYRKRSLSQEEALDEVAKFAPLEIVRALYEAVNYQKKKVQTG